MLGFFVNSNLLFIIIKEIKMNKYILVLSLLMSLSYSQTIDGINVKDIDVEYMQIVGKTLRRIGLSIY